MEAEVFITWLKHFQKWTHSSPSNPQLLLLDGHHSHKTLEAIDFAREHGIDMLTFPPHTSHRLQPLDVAFFKALKASYNSGVEGYVVSNPRKRVTCYEMGAIFGAAFNRVAAPEKAAQGFRAAGLWPLDPEIFSDADFIAASLTDEPQPEDEPMPLIDEPEVGIPPQPNPEEDEEDRPSGQAAVDAEQSKSSDKPSNSNEPEAVPGTSGIQVI